MNFPIKLLLAAASGFLVAVLFDAGPSEDSWSGWVVQYLVSGALFAFGVLWPYLRHDRRFYARGAGLIAASTLSYWCAVQIAIEWPSQLLDGADGAGFVIASIVGATIVMLAARFIAGFRWSVTYAWLGLLAAIVGGFFMHLAIDSGGWVLFVLGHTAWHALISAAIHFGSRHSNMTISSAAVAVANRH